MKSRPTQSSGSIKHGMAIAMMAVATLLWSSAGVFSRMLETASGFDMTFLRSLFCALSLFVVISLWRGMAYLPSALSRSWRQGGWMMWASGLCWALMFTIYMLAFSLTSVANVLITLSLEPLLSALLGWFFLRNHVPARTWIAIVAAGLGMAWIFQAEFNHGQWWGTALALVVPLGAATNWMLMQKGSQATLGLISNSDHRIQVNESGEASPIPSFDMLPSIFIGACLSAAFTLPFAWPLQASHSDILILSGLGLFQLALPCILAVLAAKRLPAHELAMLAMLEVVFGVLWVWVVAGEKPSLYVMQGGVLVLGALVLNEALSLRENKKGHPGVS